MFFVRYTYLSFVVITAGALMAACGPGTPVRPASERIDPQFGEAEITIEYTSLFSSNPLQNLKIFLAVISEDGKVVHSGEVLTDSDGMARFGGLPEGVYTLKLWEISNQRWEIKDVDLSQCTGENRGKMVAEFML